MNRLFRKEQILTIPNLLSLIRLLLIPLILWLYNGQKNYIATTAVVVFSGTTDITDGIIARRCNMISDFGKILDPVADKLTQLAMIYCLLSRYNWMFPLFILFVLKELIVGISGLAIIRKSKKVNSAQWFGKLATVVLYFAMIMLFLFPEISETLANGLILLCAMAILLAFVKYLLFYRETR